MTISACAGCANQCNCEVALVSVGGPDFLTIDDVAVAAALGAVLQARGYKVRLRKLDPYLNVDAGTMSPFEHGETYVLNDGGETDLDWLPEGLYWRLDLPTNWLVGDEASSV